MASSVDAIAIIGRDNDPLFFKSFHGDDSASSSIKVNNSTNEEEKKTTLDPVNTSDTMTDLMEPDPDLYLKLLVFSSLDLIEERSRGLAEKNVYLGQLCTSDHRRVYSFVTTTSTKFVVVVTDEGNEGKGVIQDSTMTAFFRQIHGLFVDTMSNPFSLTSQSGTSSARDVKFTATKKFENKIQDVIISLNESIKKR
jgi:hypothetical protein